LASIVVVSDGGGLSETVREKVATPVCPVLSVTVIVYTVVAETCVGVPDISPSDDWNINPGGNVGEIANVLVPNPPLTLTGLKGDTDWYWVRLNDCVGTVSTNGGGSTSKSKDAVSNCPRESVTVTVYVAERLSWLGLPPNAPVVGSRLTPVGKLGLTEKVRTPFPPVPCTGIKEEVIFWFKIREMLGWLTVTSKGGGDSMVMLNCLLVVLLLASVIVITKLVVVSVFAGVPEIVPVELSKDSPVGSVGEIEYTYGSAPPSAATGVNGVDALFCINITSSKSIVDVKGGSVIVRVNDLELVCPRLSVAVMVWDKLLKTKAVPVILPFSDLKLSPEGSAGVIVKAIVPTPPDADTGETKAASMNRIKVTVGWSRLVVRAGAASIVSANVLELVWSSESVTVIVWFWLVTDWEGVPEISPVTAFNDNPVGKLGDTVNSFPP
jgi:hypothetical protein